jgi:hypothetical protein
MLRAVVQDDSGLEAQRTWGEASAAAAGTGSVTLEVTTSWRHERLTVSVESPELLIRSPQVQRETADGEILTLRNGRQRDARRWVWQE